jgi:hypothetical protein
MMFRAGPRSTVLRSQRVEDQSENLEHNQFFRKSIGETGNEQVGKRRFYLAKTHELKTAACGTFLASPSSKSFCVSG